MTGYQKDLVFSVMAICLAIGTGFVAFSYSFESSYFPRVLSAFLGGVAALLLLRSWVQKKNTQSSAPAEDETSDESLSQLGAALLVFGAIIAYGFAITLVNYEVSTVVFITVMTWMFGYRKPIGNLAISCGLTALLYGVFFEFLAVARPDSIFFY